MTYSTPEQDSGPWTGYDGAANHTNLSKTFLRQLVMEDRIPFRKIGKRVLFSIPALDTWISQNGAMNQKQDHAA